MSYNIDAQPLSGFVVESGNEVRFHRLVKRGTNAQEVVECGAGDNHIGVSLPDSRYPDEKYEEDTPVPLAGSGKTAQVIVIKTAASGTSETWEEGSNLKTAADGKVEGESSGTRTAVSVGRLLEEVEFASGDAAGTESDPVWALLY